MLGPGDVHDRQRTEMADHISLGTGGPDPISRSAERHIAIVGARQDGVEALAAGREDAMRQRLCRRAILRVGREGGCRQHQQQPSEGSV